MQLKFIHPELRRGGWSKGTLVDLWGDSLRMAAHHPAPSPRWQMALYFVGEGGGAYGEQRSTIGYSGGWLQFPENLGQEINTVGDELFPHAATDSVLYFSSTGRPGYGGLDIYRATLDAAGHWTVIHLPPINSSADDFGLVFNPAKRAIDDPIAENISLFSSTRQDAKARPHHSMNSPSLPFTFI